MKQLGADHENTLQANQNYVIALLKLSKLKEAEQMIRETIKLKESKFGANNEKTIDSRYYLGTALRFQKRGEEARKVDNGVVKWRL